MFCNNVIQRLSVLVHAAGAEDLHKLVGTIEVLVEALVVFKGF